MVEEKLVYLYSEFTQEYLGTQEADLDPVATEREGKPVIMLPANATLTAPPKKKKENTAWVFKGSKWVTTPDYRGKLIANKDLAIRRHTELGELPDGYVVITEEQERVIAKDSLKYVWTEKGVVPNSNYEKDKKARENQAKINEIQSKLEAIDLKSIRAIRAGETDFLKSYEEEAEQLRVELRKLV